MHVNATHSDIALLFSLAQGALDFLVYTVTVSLSLSAADCVTCVFRSLMNGGRDFLSLSIVHRAAKLLRNVLSSSSVLLFIAVSYSSSSSVLAQTAFSSSSICAQAGAVFFFYFCDRVRTPGLYFYWTLLLFYIYIIHPIVK